MLTAVAPFTITPASAVEGDRVPFTRLRPADGEARGGSGIEDDAPGIGNRQCAGNVGANLVPANGRLARDIGLDSGRVARDQVAGAGLAAADRIAEVFVRNPYVPAQCGRPRRVGADEVALDFVILALQKDADMGAENDISRPDIAIQRAVVGVRPADQIAAAAASRDGIGNNTGVQRRSARRVHADIISLHDVALGVLEIDDHAAAGGPGDDHVAVGRRCAANGVADAVTYFDHISITARPGEAHGAKDVGADEVSRDRVVVAV